MLARRVLRCPAAALARRRVRVQWSFGVCAADSVASVSAAAATCSAAAVSSVGVAAASAPAAAVPRDVARAVSVCSSASARRSDRLVSYGSALLTGPIRTGALSVRWLTTHSSPSASPADAGPRVVSGTAPARPDASEDRREQPASAAAPGPVSATATASSASGSSTTVTVAAASPATAPPSAASESAATAASAGGGGPGSGAKLWGRDVETLRARAKSVATHVANLLAACGALATDMLWLRTMYLLANIAGLTRSAVFEPNGRPFWTGIWWALFFITANIVQMYRILTDQKDVALDEHERELYDTAFAAAFSTTEFRRLLALGTFRDIPAPDTVLYGVGDEVTHVSVVLNGAVSVMEKNVSLSTATGLPLPSRPAVDAGYRHVADLTRGRFIGEGLMKTADGSFQSSPVLVKTHTPDVRLFVIPKKELLQFFITNPSFAVNWHLLVSSDLQTKLRDTRAHNKQQTYQMMLYGILIVSRDTQLTDAQRATVERWAREHGITEEEHKLALQACGWTMKDWRRGRAHFTY